jgi:rod shape-determining protein MreD
VLIIDNIRLGNFIHPCVYVLYVMLLPFDSPKWRLMVNGFLIGFAVDLFNGTPGLNAAATVLMAYFRPNIISLTTRKSDIDGKTYPSVDEMGLQWFFVYSILLLIIHNFTLFMLEAFSFRLFGLVLLETLLSVIISSLVIVLVIYIFKPINKK